MLCSAAATSRLWRCIPVVETFIWSFPRVSREELGSYGYVPSSPTELSPRYRIDTSRVSLPVLQEIPPFETKGVMRASFSSRDVDNHTAFIRIKTNAPDEDQFIILPVEVEVTSGASTYPPTNTTPHRIQDALCVVRLTFFTPSSAAPGIYSSTEMLDFGTLRSQGTIPTSNIKGSSSISSNTLCASLMT